MNEIDPELLEERIWALEEKRFSSTRIQITSVTDLGNTVSSVLEIGPGSGYFSSIISKLGYEIKTADIRKTTNPDYLGDFRTKEIENKFDLVAAFEMLQHLPYDDVPDTMAKIADLSNRYVLISVPARVHRLELALELPPIFTPRRLGLGWLRGKHSISIDWEWPRGKDPHLPSSDNRNYDHVPHYWGIGQNSFPRTRLFNDIESVGLKILWHKYNPQHTHHLFVLAQKVSN